ncbi:MAG: hypothetical protein JW981_04265 [Anaerolineae bacterium]|nr:hypothetical protein [Anaerolineae bacterium]
MEDDRILLAYERIMEDSSLTADLVDEDAKVLLSWAEDEVKRIIAGASRLEPEVAERIISQKLSYLRRYLRRIGRQCGSAENPAEMLETLLVSPDYPQDEENIE